MTASRLDILARLEDKDRNPHGYDWSWNLILDFVDEAGLIVDIPDPSDRLTPDAVVSRLRDKGYAFTANMRFEFELWLRRLPCVGLAVVDAGTTGTTPETDEISREDSESRSLTTRWFGEWQNRPAGYDQWRTSGDHDWAKAEYQQPFWGGRSIVEARPVPQPTARWRVDETGDWVFGDTDVVLAVNGGTPPERTEAWTLLLDALNAADSQGDR